MNRFDLSGLVDGAFRSGSDSVHAPGTVPYALLAKESASPSLEDIRSTLTIDERTLHIKIVAVLYEYSLFFTIFSKQNSIVAASTAAAGVLRPGGAWDCC